MEVEHQPLKTTCVICFFQSKKHIRCTQCNHTVCRKCFQTNVSYGDFNCMFCAQPIDSLCLKKILNKHEHKKITKTKLYDDMKSHVFQNRSSILHTAEKRKQQLHEKTQLVLEKQKLKEALLNNQARITELDNQINYPNRIQTTSTRSLIYCCDPLCCEVLSVDLFCNRCESYSCELCLTVYTDKTTHSCTNTASMRTILSSSKPCPKCKTYITKGDGCNQMWCTACNTAFSWNTGLIMNESKISYDNPHRNDYLRNTDRGYLYRGIYYRDERPSLSSIRQVLIKYTKSMKIPKEYVKLIINMKQNAVELHNVMHTLSENIATCSKNDIDMYVSVLEIPSDVEMERIQTHLYKQHDKNMRTMYLRNIVEEYITNVTDKLVVIKHELNEELDERIFYEYFTYLDKCNQSFNEQIAKYKTIFVRVCHLHVDTGGDWRVNPF